jgi:hypothetical protein
MEERMKKSVAEGQKQLEAMQKAAAAAAEGDDKKPAATEDDVEDVPDMGSLPNLN